MELVPSSIEAIRSLTSGFPESALVASKASCVTEPIVAWLKRRVPVPGSPIVVEFENVYFQAKAPADASALASLVAAAVAEDALLVAEDALEVAELLLFVAWVLAVDALVEAVVALVAAAVAEFAAAVAEAATVAT